MLFNEEVAHGDGDLNRDLSEAQAPKALSMVREINFRLVTMEGDPAKSGFIETYKKAFGEYPYYEEYTTKWVEDNVWKPHQGHCIIVAEHEGRTIGLGCVHGIVGNSLSQSSRDYLLSFENLPFDPEKSVYMSELAVDSSFRGLGLGTKLVLACYDWAIRNGFETYCLRTASQGSNSLRLYQRLGGLELQGKHEVSSVEGGSLPTASKSRVYLWGNLEDCQKLIEIEKISWKE